MPSKEAAGLGFLRRKAKGYLQEIAGVEPDAEDEECRVQGIMTRIS